MLEARQFRGNFCINAMSDPSIPDHRNGHWWGLLWPRPISNCSYLSKVVSVLMVPVVLVFGVCVALLQIATLPILIVVLIAIKWWRGTLPSSPRRTASM